MTSLVNIILPEHTVKQLRRISQLSRLNEWEYAGAINFRVDKKNTITFMEPTYKTSKSKFSVELEDVKQVWPNVISYHTHPAPWIKPINPSRRSYVTLPSHADLNAYIVGYPKMQSNLILDSDGFYIIDIHDSASKLKLPVPSSVNLIMDCFRYEIPDEYRVKENTDGFEFFHATVDEWKTVITKLHGHLYRTFGISMRYISYEDPVILSINRNQFLLRCLGNDDNMQLDVR